MATRGGGQDRISTKSKLARELVVLGKVLSDAREARGLKQSVVAGRLDLPASYLSKIEKGNRRLDVIELLQLARALESDPAELVSELERRLAAEQ
ncbi:MAG: helix-turn-helix domain-containing protein [Thermoanaerobaculia bacterium]